MAIDTAEKRKSISGISLPFFAPGVTPNASKDQEWRQESAWSYSGILAGGLVTFTWSWALEAYISAAWVDITDDVLTHDHPTVISRGINGNSITDRVASVGSLTTTLDNSSTNSAAKDGYYSLGHANQRANFGRDTRVRLKFTFNGSPYYKWHGWIRNLEPLPNRFGKRESYLSAVDFMQKLIEHKISGIPVQENQRFDQLIQTVLDNMSDAPLNTSLEVGTYSTPLALTSEQDEKSTAMSVIQKICESFLLYVFVKGNTTDGETLVAQSEKARYTAESAFTLDNTMSAIQFNTDPDHIKNRILGSIFPARVDEGAETLLAELTDDYPLDAGDTKSLDLRFRDPLGASNRISGKDIVTTLIEDTHYRMSAFQDTELGDMNSLLGISLTAGSNSASVSVTNNGGVRGFINRIRVYGNGIYLYDAVGVEVSNGSGDKVTSYDFHYLQDHYRARDYLTVLLRRTSSDILQVDRVMFYADFNATFMGYAMNYDIGSRITLKEYMTGLNADFTINHVMYTLETNGTLRVEYIPEAAESVVFFTVQDPTLGELDNAANLLAPF